MTPPPAMRTPPHEGPRVGLWIGLVALLAILVLLRVSGPQVEAFAGWIKRAGPVPFFTAMTLTPLAGVPASPFYLLAGAVFGEGFTLAATGLSILANLALAYLLTRAFPAGPLQRLRRRLDRYRPAGATSMNPWTFAALVRMAPGPTVAMKNYALGLAQVPPAPYFAVSWPLSMGYAAILILLGDSAFEGRAAGLILGAVLLALFAFALRVLYRRLRSRIAPPTTEETAAS